MTKPIARLCVAATVASAAALTGCQQGPTKDERIAALDTENQQLRAERDNLTAALDDCDQRFNAVQAERNSLSGEVASLQPQLANAPAGGALCPQ